MEKPKAKELSLTGSNILSSVKKEVKKEKAMREKHPRKTSSACGSYCSGDNYCSDWHDA